jgi:aryl-alcohol dehydrogenase-like predicted oxidoreductase
MTNPLLSLKVPIGFGFFKGSWGNSPMVNPGEAQESFKRGLNAAMDAGVRLFDTADIYAPSWDTMGHNEMILRDAISEWQAPASQKEELIIATKGGITRSAGINEGSRAPGEVWGKDADYDYLMRAVEKSAKNLGLSEIPIWQHHRLATNLTFSEQIKNLRKLNENAPIRHLGVSNYSAEQLRRALDVIGGPNDGGIISIQNQLNPAYRQDMDVLEVCEEHGLAFMPYSPSKGVTKPFEGSEIYNRFDEIAKARNGSIFWIAQAWLRSLSPNIVPLPGVTRFESILDNLAGLEVRLTTAELAQLEHLPESMPVDDELVRDQPLPETN